MDIKRYKKVMKLLEKSGKPGKRGKCWGALPIAQGFSSSDGTLTKPGL
jgi:hypothetical protein